MIFEITEYFQNNMYKLDFHKDLEIKVVQIADEYLINFNGYCKFSLKFLNDLDEFLNGFDLSINTIYNQAQISLDEDFLEKIEVRTIISVRGDINEC